MLLKYSTLFTSFIRLTVTASALHLQRAGATWLQVAQELCLITAYVPVTFTHSHKILLSAPEYQNKLPACLRRKRQLRLLSWILEPSSERNKNYVRDEKFTSCGTYDFQIIQILGGRHKSPFRFFDF